MLRTEVIDILGNPEWFGLGKEELFTSDMWTYGNIEFYFNYPNPGTDRLGMIFTDNLYSLDGGNILNIDSWIFEQNPKALLSSEEVKRIMNDNKITFKLKKGFTNKQIIMLFESGIELAFDEDFENFETDTNVYALGLWSHFCNKQIK